MTSIKGSQTEKNLLKSFSGEAQSSKRYAFFAKQAKKEGFEQIAEIFTLTALQEDTHARAFFRLLEGGPVEITAVYPAGAIGNTTENLIAAANAENEEWTELYPEYEEKAKEEGFPHIARLFANVAMAEAKHEARFLKLLRNVEEARVFARDEEVEWVCRKCGFVHKGNKAPGICVLCEHPQAYFEIMASNF